MVGKKVTVSEKTSKVTAEGRFDFQQGFSKPKLPFVGVDGIGDFSFFLNKKSDFRFDMALNIDFPLPSKTVDFITKELLSSPDIVEPILYTSVNNARFKRYLYEFINDDKKFEKTWKKVRMIIGLTYRATLLTNFSSPNLHLLGAKKPSPLSASETFSWLL